MDHFVEKLEIKNFKSIRDLTLTDFRRINLFIGRPNVGKSNLLEALGMFSLWNIDYVKSNTYSRILRAETPSLLFFDGNYKSANSDKINITATTGADKQWVCSFSVKNTLRIELKYISNLSLPNLETFSSDSRIYEFNNLLELIPRATIVNETINNFKKYVFDSR